MLPGDWTDLITRGDMTPKNDETNSSAGSSLATEQNRLLHVRGICTLGDDGVKQIEQHLYNPHGSIFYFRSDETGLAPDALSYIAAGIGLCFMTQLGRYAKIVGKDLEAYRIVQDAFFSKSGGLDATGNQGTADPLETHVYLTSEQDDAFAETALDMGEQTCFLHALCRTNLAVEARVVRGS